MVQNKSKTSISIKRNTNKTISCKHCFQLIDKNAKVCYYCGRTQNKIWSIIDRGIPLTAIVMVLIAAIQILITYQQMSEAKLERIKASDALKRSELAESLADSAVNSVIEVSNEAKNRVSEFSKFLKEMEILFKDQYSSLSKEIDKLQRRNIITALGDSAISQGSREALNKLRDISNNTKNQFLKEAARSEFLRVYAMHSGVQYFGKALIDTINGKIKNEFDYTTKELIEILLNDPKWERRASSARILANHSVKGVPEALIHAIKYDENLFVVAHASESFINITGYDPPDLFYMPDIEKWWEKYSKKIINKLREQ